MSTTPNQSGYAPVNGLNMYYEIHGTGQPLLLLHGAFGGVELWGPLLPALAARRQVIAVDLQGHGRTADGERPLRYEDLADDAAALIRHLGIGQADVLGYSLGGIAVLGLAIRHPDLVRRLVTVGAVFNSEGYYPESRAVLATLTPELFAGSPVETTYQRVAPDPAAFPRLVTKVVDLDASFAGWPPEALRAVTAPALVINGDADTRPEHAVELFRLLGGGAPGDLVGLPPSRLAILPGTTHVGLVTARASLLVALVEDFLGPSLPEQA